MSSSRSTGPRCSTPCSLSSRLARASSLCPRGGAVKGRRRLWAVRTCVRMPPPYVELHCHSASSFLDGASMPDELVPAALELGHGALALTDHNSVSGSMELAQAARGLGLRAIHGAELDLDDGRHVTLLVESARGWSNLCRLITRAHAHTRGAARRPSLRPAGPARGGARACRGARLPVGLRCPRRARRGGCARPALGI